MAYAENTGTTHGFLEQSAQSTEQMLLLLGYDFSQ